MQPIIALKLDFEKAIDKVEHSVILAILKKRGFGSKWCSWVAQFPSSTTSSIVLNGVPWFLFSM